MKLAMLILSVCLVGGCQFSAEKKAMKIPVYKTGDAISWKRFDLGQPWNEKLDKDFRPARVDVAWSPEALLVRARLTDDEVMTEAVADNEQLWMLGDVLEMFIMVEGRPDYVELHVAPNGKRMHLQLPGAGGKISPNAKPVSFEKMLMNPGFKAEAQRTSGGWKVKAVVPVAVLGLKQLEAGRKLRVSFCRYDAAEGRKPVLSTTAAHPVVSFHRPDEWTVVELSR